MAVWNRAAAAVVFTFIAVAPDVVSALRGSLFVSEVRPCPVSCQSTTNSSQWTLYPSISRLSVCNEPVLFEVSLSTPLLDISDAVGVLACTSGDDQSLMNAISQVAPSEEAHEGRIARRVSDGSSSCAAPSGKLLNLELSTWGSRQTAASGPALDLLREASDWASKQGDCDSTTAFFGHLNGTYVGYFASKLVDNAGTADNLVAQLIKSVSNDGVPDRMLIQQCSVDHAGGLGNSTKLAASALGPGVITGAVIATDGDFSKVHGALRSWNEAECVAAADFSRSLPGSEISVYPIPESSALEVRQSGGCRTIQVFLGDHCGTLATRCGIHGDDYMKYNPGSNHCSGLVEGQLVCCSAGGLPDLRPKQNPDGSCAAYDIQRGDSCNAIAVRHGMIQKDIFDLNKNTWGWSGCDPLPHPLRICLSPGSPPLPAEISNAVCGPQKPGTSPPRGDQKLGDLNACPLKACCNKWAQCGLTEDFCYVASSPTGAPGTSAHPNGCIQNCGTGIINNGQPPAIFRKLGYFEAWNMGRNCLRMDVREIVGHRQGYTDIHFSFGEISPSLDVVIPQNQMGEWNKFIRLRGPGVPRKVLAFGGWAFSTSASTWHLFPLAVNPANRVAFARKVVDFAAANNLDGLDFDWEYPGSPDIPGMPHCQDVNPDRAGCHEEGENYLHFLEEVRRILPSHMTLSIAAPASYWYLKAFPIERMAPLLDYIVYMTYDLHGQWDSGNPWSSPGCPGGNCLRSHINDTETEDTLSMITRAGVPSHKILVGVATYGRSFKMTDPGCAGPGCTFHGIKESPAKAGICTGEPGYLALAEINKILQENPSARTWVDASSQSRITVYDGNEWVAYMDQPIREAREAKARSRNFGGTIEWAVDLQEFRPGDGISLGAGLPAVDPSLNWKAIHCSSPGVINTANASDWRWAEVRAAAAWDDAIRGWKYNRTNPPPEGLLPFPHSIGNFYNSPQGMSCHKLIDVNGCHGGLNPQCHDTNHPAGYFILISFRHISSTLWNVHSSLGRNQGRLTNLIDTLVDKFAPVPSQGLNLAQFLDLILLGWGGFSAPMWNKWLKNSPWGQKDSIRGDNYGTIKDFTNDMIKGGMTTIKDFTASPANNNYMVRNTLKVQMTNLIQVWQKSLELFAERLFSGSDADIERLGKMIGYGKLMNDKLAPPSASEMDKDIIKPLFGFLITMAWRISSEDMNPFILDSEESCANAKNADHIRRRVADIDGSFICDKANDRGYFLVSAPEPRKNCWDQGPGIGGNGKAAGCYKYPQPRGASLLTGNADDWGGITREEVVLGSLSTFRQTGNKNNPDYNFNELQQDDKTIDAISERSVMAPGFFRLPICNVAISINNYQLNRRGDRPFPCER